MSNSWELAAQQLEWTEQEQCLSWPPLVFSTHILVLRNPVLLIGRAYSGPRGSSGVPTPWPLTGQSTVAPVPSMMGVFSSCLVLVMLLAEIPRPPYCHLPGEPLSG